MNEHLNIEDIIKFVSIDDLSEESVKLTVKVNGHIRNCDKCLKLVTAVQVIYDEFVRLGTNGEFRNYFFDELLAQRVDGELSQELSGMTDTFEE